MWTLKHHCRIAATLVTLIQQVCVHSEKLSEAFEVKTNVRQGCIPKPLLFIMVIDSLMRETAKK